MHSPQTKNKTRIRKAKQALRATRSMAAKIKQESIVAAQSNILTKMNRMTIQSRGHRQPAATVKLKIRPSSTGRRTRTSNCNQQLRMNSTSKYWRTSRRRILVMTNTSTRLAKESNKRLGNQRIVNDKKSKNSGPAVKNTTNLSSPRKLTGLIRISRSLSTCFRTRTRMLAGTRLWTSISLDNWTQIIMRL